MKKVFVTTLLSTTLGAAWFGLALHAGSGHDHGPNGHSHGQAKEQASKQTVLTSANQHVKQLIQNNKIDGYKPTKGFLFPCTLKFA